MKDKPKDGDLEQKVRIALKRGVSKVDVGKGGLKEIQKKIKSNRGKRIK